MSIIIFSYQRQPEGTCDKELPVNGPTFSVNHKKLIIYGFIIHLLDKIYFDYICFPYIILRGYEYQKLHPLNEVVLSS